LGLFSRRKQTPPEQRGTYRRPFDEDATLAVVIERSEQEPLNATLLDLTMRGAGLRVAEPKGAGPLVGDVIELTIQSERDGWKIHTPGVVRQVKLAEGGALVYGVEFINLGMLYAQMDDTLAAYFNRRSRVRVQSEEQKPLSASLYSAGHRLMAVVFDLTARGVGLLVQHHEATSLRIDAPSRVTIDLPGIRRGLQGAAVIRQHRAIHDQDVVGLEFDLEAEDGFKQHAERIEEYCAKRLAERATWEQQEPWCEGDEAEKPADGEEAA